MIHEVDSALRALIEREALGASGVEVVFDAPTREWAGRRNAPTINVYLYDIREDLRRRERGLLNEYDKDQRTSHATCPHGTSNCPIWSPPGLSDPRTSTRLLSSLLSGFLRFDALPADLLSGPLAELGLPVAVTVGLPPPEDRAFADVWSALGGELKPSIDVVVSAPIDTGQRYEAAPLVTAAARVTIGGTRGWPPVEQAGGHRPTPPKRRVSMQRRRKPPTSAAPEGSSS